MLRASSSAPVCGDSRYAQAITFEGFVSSTPKRFCVIVHRNAFSRATALGRRQTYKCGYSAETVGLLFAHRRTEIDWVTHTVLTHRGAAPRAVKVDLATIHRVPMMRLFDNIFRPAERNSNTSRRYNAPRNNPVCPLAHCLVVVEFVWSFVDFASIQKKNIYS